MKRWYARLSIITLFAVLIGMAYSRSSTDSSTSFEEETGHISAVERALGNEQCPLKNSVLEQEPTWLIDVCSLYGVDAYVAARRYPNISPEVFGIYGNVPEFREILATYGHPVIPVIASFVKDGPNDAAIHLQETIGQIIAALRSSNRTLEIKASDIKPEQYGLIGIMEIKAGGHALLDQFIMVKGQPQRLLSTRVLFDIRSVFAGGIINLEDVLRHGERLPTWREIADAALDTAIIGGAGAKAFKLVRGAGKVARTGRTVEEVEEVGKTEDVAAMSKTTRSAGLLEMVSGTTKIVSVVTVAFVATHPVWTMKYAAWLAVQAGLPAWAGIAIALVIVALALMFALPILLPILATFLLGIAVSITSLCATAGFKLFRTLITRTLAYGYRKIRTT